MSAGAIGGYYYSGAHTGRISSSSVDKDDRVDDSLMVQKNYNNPVNITNVSDLYMKQPRAGSSSQTKQSMSGTAADTFQNMNSNNSTAIPSQFQLYGNDMA